MNSPTQPSAQLLSERAERVVWLGLGILEKMLGGDSPASSPERMDAVANAVNAACAAMLPDDDRPKFNDND